MSEFNYRWVQDEPEEIDEDLECVVAKLEELSDAAYGWNISGKVVGLPVTTFERLMDTAAGLLKEQPDIVKCEDCKHCVWATKTRMSDCGKTGLIIKPGFYCAFGERRTDNA